MNEVLGKGLYIGLCWLSLLLPPSPQITTVEWTSPKRERSVVNTAQFKLTEKSVHIFPKGLSPAVL